MTIKPDLKYTKSHEWIKIEGGTALVGITDHAQSELTDIVFVELPEVGKMVRQGDPVVVIESVKIAADVYAPLDGKVIEVNSELENDPGLINRSCYEEGWLFRIESSGNASDHLLSADQYKSEIGN